MLDYLAGDAAKVTGIEVRVQGGGAKEPSQGRTWWLRRELPFFVFWWMDGLGLDGARLTRLWPIHIALTLPLGANWVH